LANHIYGRQEKEMVFFQANESSDFLEWFFFHSSPVRHVEIMFTATLVLPSDCLKREVTKINRDVKYLRFKWHYKHTGAVKGV
jgi:hypothetical protein